MTLDAYTCDICEHTQRQHWHAARHDNNRSYCTVGGCVCVHFVMKRVAEPDLTEPAWEYGFYDSENGPDPIWWYTFGGLVGFETVEMAKHTASKSVWGQAVIVRRRKGSTDWEPAEP